MAAGKGMAIPFLGIPVGMVSMGILRKEGVCRV